MKHFCQSSLSQADPEALSKAEFQIEIYLSGFEQIVEQPFKLSDLQHQRTTLTMNNNQSLKNVPPNPFRINRRKIELLSDRKKLKRIGNIPKSLIGNFYKYLPQYEKAYTQSQNYVRTRETVGEWLRKKNDLNRWHLRQLFCKQDVLSYENRRVLRKMIEDNIWKMTGLGTKVENTLTYMVCLEKYTTRLGNGKLASRIQI